MQVRRVSVVKELRLNSEVVVWVVSSMSEKLQPSSETSCGRVSSEGEESEMKDAVSPSNVNLEKFVFFSESDALFDVLIRVDVI